MRIVVVGAYGLIGSYVTARLLADGHDLVGVGRDVGAARRRVPEVSWVEADLRTTSVEAWAALLRGADALVNCAGALQDSPRDDLQAVHLEAVRRLAAACRLAGVRRFVHLSAAGVAAGRGTAFNQTKLAAEAVLKGEDLDWIILRPGLVLAPAAYGGTALLRGLAAFPYLVPVVYPASVVQVVSVEDVAAAVARAVPPEVPARVSVDLVHGEVLSFAAVALELRRWLGLAPARLVALPPVLARAAARLSDGLAYLGWRSPMRTAALEQLRMGIEGEAGAAERHLDLAPRSLRQMLNGWPAGVQERWFAKVYFLKPAILAGLGLFWFLSGLISVAFSFPEAVGVLTLAGVSSPLAKGAVIAGAAVDMALGLGLCVRRWAGPALQGMLLVCAAYLIGGTLVQPGLWLDPLGPLLKIVPAALLAATALALLDER